MPKDDQLEHWHRGIKLDGRHPQYTQPHCTPIPTHRTPIPRRSPTLTDQHLPTALSLPLPPSPSPCPHPQCRRAGLCDVYMFTWVRTIQMASSNCQTRGHLWSQENTEIAPGLTQADPPYAFPTPSLRIPYAGEWASGLYFWRAFRRGSWRSGGHTLNYPQPVTSMSVTIPMHSERSLSQTHTFPTPSLRHPYAFPTPLRHFKRSDVPARQTVMHGGLFNDSYYIYIYIY